MKVARTMIALNHEKTLAVVVFFFFGSAWKFIIEKNANAFFQVALRSWAEYLLLFVLFRFSIFVKCTADGTAAILK